MKKTPQENTSNMDGTVTFGNLPLDIEKQIYDITGIGCFFKIAQVDKKRNRIMKAHYLFKEKIQAALTINKSHVLVEDENTFYISGKEIKYFRTDSEDKIKGLMKQSFADADSLKAWRSREAVEWKIINDFLEGQADIKSGTFEENHIPVLKVRLRPGLYKEFTVNKEFAVTEFQSDGFVRKVDSLNITVKREDILHIKKVFLPTFNNLEVEVSNSVNNIPQNTK